MSERERRERDSFFLYFGASGLTIMILEQMLDHCTDEQYSSAHLILQLIICPFSRGGSRYTIRRREGIGGLGAGVLAEGRVLGWGGERCLEAGGMLERRESLGAWRAVGGSRLQQLNY